MYLYLFFGFAPSNYIQKIELKLLLFCKCTLGLLRVFHFKWRDIFPSHGKKGWIWESLDKWIEKEMSIAILVLKQNKLCPVYANKVK